MLTTIVWNIISVWSMAKGTLGEVESLLRSVSDGELT